MCCFRPAGVQAVQEISAEKINRSVTTENKNYFNDRLSNFFFLAKFAQDFFL